MQYYFIYNDLTRIRAHRRPWPTDDRCFSRYRPTEIVIPAPFASTSSNNEDAKARGITKLLLASGFCRIAARRQRGGEGEGRRPDEGRFSFIILFGFAFGTRKGEVR